MPIHANPFKYYSLLGLTINYYDGSLPDLCTNTWRKFQNQTSYNK